LQQPGCLQPGCSLWRNQSRTAVVEPAAVRTLAVIAVCLAATAVGLGHAVINPDVPMSWLVSDLALAAIALVLRGGSVLAGGLIANALVAQLCGGVPDFVPLAGRLLSPGDLAIVLGFLPILYRYSKPVSEESFVSDC
jgi:hypothetical protein